jgi:uncharacterized protein (TIGR02391 family)
MANSILALFERVARRAHLFSDEAIKLNSVEHPFETRNIHPMLPQLVRGMFDDGYYSQATFESCKYLDKEVGRIANLSETGYKLMMKAFHETSPLLALNTLTNESDRDEQMGFKFIFSGTAMGIRNPRGHEYKIRESIDECLDYLGLISALLRRIEKAGYSLKS